MTAPLDDLMGNPVSEHSKDLDESEVEIDVVDDRPEEDQVPPREERQPLDVDEEIDNLSGGVGKRIKRLKYEYHEERRAKEAAERMSQEAVRFAEQSSKENKELKGLLQRGEKALLSEMKTRADSDLLRARAQYKVAYETGDPDAIVKAQESLNQSQINREAARRSGVAAPGPARKMSRRQAQQAQRAQQQQQQQPPAQPDPKLKSWLNDNEWFGKDEEMTSFAYGVHEKLVRKEGVDPRSDEYYEKIDARMNEVFPDRPGNDMGTEEPAASSRGSTVVAPAIRSSGKPRKVQLTSTQVSLAKRLGITPEQYAKQLLKEVG